MSRNPIKKWSTSAIGIMICLLILGMVMAACSQESATDSSSVDPEEESEVRGDITVSVYDRGSVPAAEGTVENNRWTEWVNEEGPANVTFMPISRWEARESFNTLFAAGDAPDLILDYDTGYLNELYNQQQLMPLDEIIEEHSNEYKEMLEEYPILRSLGTNDDGQLYKMGRINIFQTNHVLYIRKDWLDKLGLDIPETTDELFEVARAFSEQDPNETGEDDTYGIALSFISGATVDRMFQNVTWVIEEGELVKDWERARDAVEFKKQLFEAGVVDRDFLTDSSGEKAQQDFVSGNLGIWGANAGSGSAGLQVFKTLRENDPTAEILPMQLPRGPYGQFSPTIDNPVHINAGVNANAEDPVAVIQYVDFLVREETGNTLRFGIEGEHHEIGEGGCPKIVDQNKFEQEVGWNGDFQMLTFSGLYECFPYKNQLNLDDPIEKEFYDIIQVAEENYLSPERPMPEITHPEHMPTPPQEIALIVSNIQDTINALWERAIVSGDTLTPDQAMEEAQKIWLNAGGEQVEKWYAEWYQENKDNWLLTEDIYQFAD